MVFTVPQHIEAIAYQNKALPYDMLFKATAQTLRTIAADPKHLGAEFGFIAVLHTLGPEPAAPPASALRRARRRDRRRRQALDRLPARVLP